MPDWQELVRQCLSGLTLDSAVRDEVHAELAAHLEETCESWRSFGLSEQDAVQRTLAQVPDWQDLQRKISFAKKERNSMHQRLHQLWIPGFVTLLLSSVFLMMLQKYGYQPRIASFGGPGTTLFYVPWLASLPLIGALAASLSLRAGSSRRNAVVASIFPVLTFVAAIFVILPISFILDSHVDHHVRLASFGRVFVEWVLMPGAALLVGGLLVQVLLLRRLSARGVAGH